MLNFNDFTTIISYEIKILSSPFNNNLIDTYYLRETFLYHFMRYFKLEISNKSEYANYNVSLFIKQTNL